MTESSNQESSNYTIVHHMAVHESEEISPLSSSDDILASIENYLLLNKEILQKSRRRDLVDQRRMVCFLLREHTKLPLATIGRLMGGKDHATVMYNIKTHKQLYSSNDQEYRFNTRQLIKQFKNLL